MLLTVKTKRDAVRIAKALDRTSSAAADNYMAGFDKRRTIEKAALTAANPHREDPT